MNLPNYDTWKTNSFGRFECAQEQRASAVERAVDAIRSDPEDLYDALDELDVLEELVQYAMTGNRKALDKSIDSAILHAAEKQVDGVGFP